MFNFIILYNQLLSTQFCNLVWTKFFFMLFLPYSFLSQYNMFSIFYIFNGFLKYLLIFRPLSVNQLYGFPKLMHIFLASQANHPIWTKSSRKILWYWVRSLKIRGQQNCSSSSTGMYQNLFWQFLWVFRIKFWCHERNLQSINIAFKYQVGHWIIWKQRFAGKNIHQSFYFHLSHETAAQNFKFEIFVVYFFIQVLH